MSVDIFSRTNALKLLNNKELLFFGDSNTRSIYKDLVWLLEYGTLVPQSSLKVKNELQHANDFKTSNKPLTSGRDYEETREYYNCGIVVKFTFLTKIFSKNLISAINSKSTTNNVIIIINSCVWDLSRWGPNGVSEYKRNVVETMEFFKKHLSTKCRVIFTTTLPLSSSCRGGFLKPEVEFLRYQLPWHVIEANNYLAEMAKLYKYDILDLHYYTRFLLAEWMSDGIHWSPLAYRLLTNFILNHLSLSCSSNSNNTLPGQFVKSTISHHQDRKQQDTIMDNVNITNTNNKVDATSVRSVIHHEAQYSINKQINNDKVDCKMHQVPANVDVDTTKTEEFLSVDISHSTLSDIEVDATNRNVSKVLDCNSSSTLYTKLCSSNKNIPIIHTNFDDDCNIKPDYKTDKKLYPECDKTDIKEKNETNIFDGINRNREKSNDFVENDLVMPSFFIDSFSPQLESLK